MIEQQHAARADHRARRRAVRVATIEPQHWAEAGQPFGKVGEIERDRGLNRFGANLCGFDRSHGCGARWNRAILGCG
ncbi:MAG: hypothetical protein ACREJT_14740 [Myxococcota bacterium]